jgi:hypothetical protein
MILMKSNTFKSGVSMATILTLLATYREAIVATLDVTIGQGKGDAVFTTVTAFIGLIGTFGVGKGRLDADKKPPLHTRK